MASPLWAGVTALSDWGSTDVAEQARVSGVRQVAGASVSTLLLFSAIAHSERSSSRRYELCARIIAAGGQDPWGGLLGFIAYKVKAQASALAAVLLDVSRCRTLIQSVVPLVRYTSSQPHLWPMNVDGSPLNPSSNRGRIGHSVFGFAKRAMWRL